MTKNIAANTIECVINADVSTVYVAYEALLTYSTVLLHGGGLLIVMNTQFERMVIMMNILNNLILSQGKMLDA